MQNLTGIDNFCGSTFWNETLIWYNEDPYFTRCFERTVLVWIPCIFLWVFSPLDIREIKLSKDRNIPWNLLNGTKLVVTCSLAFLGLVDMATALMSGSTSNVHIYVPAIQTFSFGYSGLLQWYLKRYGVKSSGVQFIFWLLLTICGIPQFRTELHLLSLQTDTDPYKTASSYLIYYPGILVMLLLNFFADQSHNLTDPKGKKLFPEDSASFPSRIFFSWFDSLAWKGYKKPLEESDLWELSNEVKSSEVIPPFEAQWQKELNKRNSKNENINGDAETIQLKGNDTDDIKDKRTASVLPVMIKTYWVSYLLAVFLELFNILLIFINPQILGLLISYVTLKEEEWKGYVYAVLLFIVPSIQTLITARIYYMMVKIGMKMRTALTSLIYKKSLKLSNAAKKESTVGEIVNLMAVDCQKFLEAVYQLNFMWSGPLQIAFAMYFLWQELGPSILVGLGLMILLIPLNIAIASKSKKYQGKQMKYKDERVKLMNEILNGMKVLKLYAWEESFESYISKFRAREIKELTLSGYTNAGAAFIWQCAPFMVTLATFATYVLIDEKNVLDANKAYVSISLFNILRFPLNLVPMMLSSLVQTYVSIKRINKFLNSEEVDPRNVTHEEDSAALVIEDGNFAWEEAPILTNINIRVDKGNLTAVVGSVGSGKSSLVSALLGEMNKLSGRVNTVGSIAYVPQQAWIQNATLRDNILFGKEFNKDWYRRVIEACALKPDFAILPGGDETEIGEKGINLSGGQKQRISLARAVYAKNQVYILDDPLSAVDSHVGKHIFEKVIGPNGLLGNTTRLLVTHGITYLPYTEDIIVLKDGKISERGTYEQLLQRKGDFADFLDQHISQISPDSEDLDEIVNQLNRSEVADDVSQMLKRQISAVSQKSLTSLKLEDSDRAHAKSTSKMSLHKSIESLKKNDGKKLIEVEQTQKGGVNWKIYAYYFKSVGIMLILTKICLVAVFQMFSIFSNVWLSYWADDKDMVVDGIVDTAKRDMYLTVYGSLGIGQALSMVIAQIIYARATLSGAKKIHDFLTSNVLRFPMSFFDITPLGRVLARFSNDINGVDLLLPQNFGVIFINTCKVVAILLIICLTIPQFIFVIIPVIIVYYFLQSYYVATSRQLKRLDSVSRSPIYSHFGETLTGAQAIRAFGQQNRFILESYKKVDQNQSCYLPGFISSRWLAIRLEIIGNLIIFFAALFCVWQRDTQPGLVGLVVSYSMQITSTLNWLVKAATEVQSNMVAVERIKEYEEYPKEAAWKIESKAPASSWPEEGVIEFQNFGLRYRPGLDLVLKNLTFTVKGGEKVGIVGRTGAGKSSLTLALFRLIESAHGKILIDNLDISQMGLHSLRSKLTIIPQDAVLFSGTLRMNLDPFEQFSDEEVWRSLEHAHLKSFVKELGSGLQHQISEGGENLSVGQRQLICLARALLRKTKILILDEATAAVDLDTDDLIQNTIRTAFKDCTVLTIAHRLNTIMDSDRIVVLDKGEIIEFKSPQMLLEDSNSIFYSMCKDAGIV